MIAATNPNSTNDLREVRDARGVSGAFGTKPTAHVRAEVDALGARFDQVLRERQGGRSADHPSRTTRDARDARDRADDHVAHADDAAVAAQALPTVMSAAMSTAQARPTSAEATPGGTAMSLGACDEVSATARSLASRHAWLPEVDASLSSRSPAAAGVDGVWSVQLPALDGWTLQATSTQGHWQLAFVTDVHATMDAGTAFPASVTDPTLSAPGAWSSGLDAQTLCAQAAALARRLEASGTPLSSAIEVVTPENQPREGDEAHDDRAHQDSRGSHDKHGSGDNRDNHEKSDWGDPAHARSKDVLDATRVERPIGSLEASASRRA